MMLLELPRIAVRLDQDLDPYRCIELAVVAETSGYSSLWFAENPLHRAILPAISACALQTQRIRLGIGIINTYQHHPSLIAMEAAALDELARGRILLGIGSGVGSRIARLGFDYRPVSALRDATQIIRALLRGEETSYRGHAFCVDRVRLRFQPPRSDMPVYFASMGDRSLALCGELADGLIVSNLCPPDIPGAQSISCSKALRRPGGRRSRSCSTYPAPCGRIVTKLCVLQKWLSARCWPPSGQWAAIGRSCAKPSCGIAALAKARWLPRWLGYAAARRPTECLATALSRLSRLPGQPRSVLRPRRAMAMRVSTSS